MYNEMAEYFKVLGDPNRLKIVELLLKGETCGCTLIDKLPITQPTLSYHLNTLVASGLARNVKDGTKSIHFINQDKLDEIIAYLEGLKHLEVESCNL